MSLVKGIYAASLSVLNENLSLNFDKTIYHAENLIDNGCNGVAIFGSTGQAQLISVSEKIQLINKLSKSKYQKKFIIGTGLNSLIETLNLIRIGKSLNFSTYLIMPPAYYKYGDQEVIDFYSKILDNIGDIKIILYNFEKLCGYKFSLDCIENLVKKFPKNIIGVKDSSYNLYETLKIENFSVLPGSETKLLRGLELGCSGIITATCNATSVLAKKVYDDFQNNKKQNYNKKLCEVRKVFEQFNLISALHTLMSEEDVSYKNIIPPLRLLDEKNKKKLLLDLARLKFKIEKLKAA